MKNRPRPNTAFTNLFSEDAPQRGTSREQRLPFRSQISVDRHCLRARLLNGSPTLDGVSTVLPAGATASLETRGGLGASALATVQPTATFPATGRRPAGPTGPPRASPTPARIRESARTVAILQPTQARRSTFEPFSEPASGAARRAAVVQPSPAPRVRSSSRCCGRWARSESSAPSPYVHHGAQCLLAVGRCRVRDSARHAAPDSPILDALWKLCCSLSVFCSVLFRDGSREGRRLRGHWGALRAELELCAERGPRAS